MTTARRKPHDGRTGAHSVQQPARSPTQREPLPAPPADTPPLAAKRARKRRPRFVL